MTEELIRESQLAGVLKEIRKKLVEVGRYSDEDGELSDYIMIMIANKRTKYQLQDDLSLFLGSATESFVDWLYTRLDYWRQSGQAFSPNETKTTESAHTLLRAAHTASQVTPTNNTNTDTSTTKPGGNSGTKRKRADSAELEETKKIRDSGARNANYQNKDNNAVELVLNEETDADLMSGSRPNGTDTNKTGSRIYMASNRQHVKTPQNGHDNRPAISARLGPARVSRFNTNAVNFTKNRYVVDMEQGEQEDEQDQNQMDQDQEQDQYEQNQDEQTDLREKLAGNSNVNSKAERCKFYPACKSGDKCPFLHPSKPCLMFPNCRFGDLCLYKHPMCKFDFNCMNRHCPFAHSMPRFPPTKAPVTLAHAVQPTMMMTPKMLAQGHVGALAPVATKCKFGMSCLNPACPFIHPRPEPCRFGSNCLLETCAFTHPSDKKTIAETEAEAAAKKAASNFKWTAAQQQQSNSDATKIEHNNKDEN